MYKVTITNGSDTTVIHHHDFNEVKVQVGQIKQVVNLSSSFSFEMLPHNPGYNLIRPFKTLVKVENMQNGKIEFEGRVLIPTESMSDDGKFAKAFLCESELGYLNDSCQRHGEYRDITIKQFLQVMVDQHNREVASDDIDKRFVLGEVTVVNNTDNVYRYLGYEKSLESINDKLVSRLGGELWVRKEGNTRYLDYLIDAGELKQTEIRLARNLKSIEKEVDPNDVITRLIPLGMTIESDEEGAVDASQARLTIADVNGGIDYIEDAEAKALYGVATRSQTWDDITLAPNLLTRGRQFIRENNRVKVKYVFTALDLSLIGLDTDSFELGNRHPVINPVMGINEVLRFVEKNIDIIDPANNSIVAGDLFKTASQAQSEMNRSRRNLVNIEGTVSRQSQSIGVLKQEVTAVNEAVKDIKITLDGSDLPGLEAAVLRLNLAIMDLDEAISEMPNYQPATQLTDGLMSKEDKTKIDTLQNYQPATPTVDGLFSAADKEKLNGIDGYSVD